MSNPLPMPQPSGLNDAKGQTTQAGYRYMQSLDQAARSASSSIATLEATLATKAGQTFALPAFIEYPEAKDYKVLIKAPFAMTVTSVTTICTTGTATLTVKINSTALGGAANSVSTSEQSQSHSSANSVAVGDDIVLTFSSVSSVENVSVMVSGTYSLA